jgi:hypothetical protein
MRCVDVDFHGLGYRARLLEARAPDTAAALWAALPFSGRIVHGKWSGEIFRMWEPAPIDAVGDRG